MIAARELHPPATLWLCAALAVAVHGTLLFAWKVAPRDSPASAIEGDSVEVTLVESAPPATAAVAEPQPPVTPPEPEPLPPPEPPRKEPVMVLPEPPKPTPPPRTATPSPKSAPQPPRRVPAQRTSSTTGAAAATGTTAGTSSGNAVRGDSAKASFVIRPLASYPAESRAAGEQGVVVLRLVVDANGRPTSVTVARSSGFPRLDRAAIEAGWRCRVRDAAPGSRLDAPVRFNLSDR